MGRLKLRYREGDVFEVPLPPGARRAFGLVARCTTGPGFLGYYFLRPEVPDPATMRKEDAVLIANTSDLALMGSSFERRGLGEVRWKVVGHVDGFTRAAWPVPLFHRDGLGLTASSLIEYDDDAQHEIAAYRAEPGDEKRYFADGADGAGSVEQQLELLREGRELPMTSRPAA